MGEFQFDFRNVRSPYIGAGHIEFFLDGSFTHKHEACYGLEPSPIYADNETWSPCAIAEKGDACPEDESETQFVFSQEIASCMLTSIAASPLGKVALDTAKVNEMFGLTGAEAYVFDSDHLG